ncbi:MAG: hypothetical protein KC492_45295 [Myxococcales bacterium]|nr:hypothetical protein [Myxococcales bacterium]
MSPCPPRRVLEALAGIELDAIALPVPCSDLAACPWELPPDSPLMASRD